MIVKKEYEGNNYIFKKNSMNKIWKKYNQTYQYVLVKILQTKKYLNKFQKNISIDDNLLNVVESTASDFDLDNTKIYNYNSFNKKLKKCLNKNLKYEKKHKDCDGLNVVKLYKMIEKEDYSHLRTIAIDDPDEFLKALYLYTIVED